MSSPFFEATEISFKSSRLTSKTAIYAGEYNKQIDLTGHNWVAASQLTVELSSFTTYATLWRGWKWKYLGPSGIPVQSPEGSTFNSNSMDPLFAS